MAMMCCERFVPIHRGEQPGRGGYVPRVFPSHPGDQPSILRTTQAADLGERLTDLTLGRSVIGQRGGSRLQPILALQRLLSRHPRRRMLIRRAQTHRTLRTLSTSVHHDRSDDHHTHQHHERRRSDRHRQQLALPDTHKPGPGQSRAT